MENLTEMVFILDRSGSMAGLEKDTIGGFNSLLEKQKKEKGKALVTTMLFDDDFTLVHDRQPIHRVAPLTEEQYFVRGCTALLDAIVLAVVSNEKEGTYGYKITQDVRSVLEVSESTLYPVLRRLQRDECLETYDQAYAGRNRRYYKITEKGMAQLNLYRVEWNNYSMKISKLFEGGIEV